MALLAHCAALSVNVVQHLLNREPRRLAHADALARAVNLDMAASWSPTVDNYLGRVPKARILEAVREAKGDASAQLIEHLKKPDMAREAERLLAGAGWLPEPLRPQVAGSADGDDGVESLPAFLDDGRDEDTGELTESDSEEP
jgi:ParB family chromosome partitioning protein